MFLALALLFSDLPEPLRRFEAARAMIETADVRWSLMDANSWTNPGETLRFRTFHGGPDSAVFPLDQYQGKPVKIRHANGSTREIEQAATARLSNADGNWEYRVDGILVFHRDVPQLPHMPPDIRLVGMSSSFDVTQACRIGSVFDAMASEAIFSQEVRDGFEVVTARWQNGTATRFFIDPQVGWNAVRVESLGSNDQLRQSVTTTYEQRGGVWFPASCQAIDEQTGEVCYLVEIEHADVNNPDLPKRLEPEHIGIQNDMTVVLVHRDGRQVAYSEGRLVPRDEEHRAAVRSGRVRQGDKVAEFRKDRRGFCEPMNIDELRKVRVDRSHDDWERYTLRFIELYQLDEKQRESAMAILKKCQQERDEWLRENFDKVERRLADEPADRPRPQLEARLLKPVQRIFDGKLKPQLFKLPTTAQIEASRDPELIRPPRP